jgi:hypothetical protein
MREWLPPAIGQGTVPLRVYSQAPGRPSPRAAEQRRLLQPEAWRAVHHIAAGPGAGWATACGAVEPNSELRGCPHILDGHPRGACLRCAPAWSGCRAAGLPGWWPDRRLRADRAAAHAREGGSCCAAGRAGRHRPGPAARHHQRRAGPRGRCRPGRAPRHRPLFCASSLAAGSGRGAAPPARAAPAGGGRDGCAGEPAVAACGGALLARRHVRSLQRQQAMNSRASAAQGWSQPRFVGRRGLDGPARALLAPLPHLPPLALQAPHTLLPPLRGGGRAGRAGQGAARGRGGPSGRARESRAGRRAPSRRGPAAHLGTHF